MAGKQKLIHLEMTVPAERREGVQEYLNEMKDRFETASTRRPTYDKDRPYPQRYPMSTYNLLLLAAFAAKHFPVKEVSK